MPQTDTTIEYGISDQTKQMIQSTMVRLTLHCLLLETTIPQMLPLNHFIITILSNIPYHIVDLHHNT